LGGADLRFNPLTPSQRSALKQVHEHFVIILPAIDYLDDLQSVGPRQKLLENQVISIDRRMILRIVESTGIRETPEALADVLKSVNVVQSSRQSVFGDKYERRVKIVNSLIEPDDFNRQNGLSTH
jgi:hypothetical protein